MAFIAVAAAAVGTLGASGIDNLLRYAAAGHDARLAAISLDAEQLQTFSRHIRKASYAPEPETTTSFGGPYAGQVQSHRQLEPGSRLVIRYGDKQARMFQVLASRRIEQTVALAPSIGDVSSGHSTDLMLVSGRLVGTSEAVIQILVTVNSQKPLADGALDQRTL